MPKLTFEIVRGEALVGPVRILNDELPVLEDGRRFGSLNARLERELVRLFVLSVQEQMSRGIFKNLQIKKHYQMSTKLAVNKIGIRDLPMGALAI